MTETLGTCYFCGGGPLSVEHVFGRAWIEEQVPRAIGIYTLMERGKEGAVRERTRWSRKPGKGAGAEVKSVCKKCNSGWMRAMDKEVQPLLDPLCFVEPGSIVFTEGNELLATWATKIALMMASMTFDVGAFIPVDVRREFFRKPKPLPNSTVWIAAISRSGDLGGRQNGATFRPNRPPRDDHLFVATFHVLHVVFQVVCHLRLEIPVVRQPQFARYVRRLWPPEAVIDWPPPRGVWLPGDSPAFNAFAEGWAA